MNDDWRLQGGIIFLNCEFKLIRAKTKEFAINYSTYGENIWFRRSWGRRLAIFDDELLLDY